MKIIEITENKKAFLPLLLLADEQESMIDRYLSKGLMFILDDGGAKAVCVVTDEGGGVLEIKNLAVNPADQRRGYGRKMIFAMEERFSGVFRILRVGTGDSPLTIPFYEACGFRRAGAIKNFFTDHYDHPIFEEGVLLKDMILLEKPL